MNFAISSGTVALTLACWLSCTGCFASQGDKPPKVRVGHLVRRTSFSAEDGDAGDAKPPSSILDALATQEVVRRSLDNESPFLTHVPSGWVRCYQVHLGIPNEDDYMIVGAGPLIGANVTNFWLYRMLNGKAVLVMNAPEHDVEILGTRHSGLRDLRLTAATAVDISWVVLHFDGQVYKRFRGKTQAIQ
jgi:hypothetical protein